jgi:dihydrofolate synthase/folylpolyglutamate synthase
MQTVKQYTNHDRLFFLVAMMKDKRTEEMLAILAEEADMIVATEVKGQARSLAAAELARQLRQVNSQVSVFTASDAREGIRFIQERMKENDLCVITGSLFLVTETRPLLIQAKNE